MPGLEAHGGYTFCGTAALVILGKEHMLDLKALLVSGPSASLIDPFEVFAEVLSLEYFQKFTSCDEVK